MRLVRGAVTLCGVSAVCLLTYRGVKLYMQNDVVISVTEIVRLPPSSGVMVARPRGSDGPLVVQGKVEVETCTMRSYRYLLKLSAHLYQDELQASLAASGTSNGSWAVGTSAGGGAGGALVVASGRRRVASTLPNSFVRTNSGLGGGDNPGSPRDFTIPSSPSDTSARSRRNAGNGNSSNNNNSARSGGRSSVNTGTGSQLPVLVVNDMHYMVDQYEVVDTNHICFTPCCVTYATLMRYTGTVAPTPSASSAAGASSSSSAVVEPSALAAVRQSNPLSTIAIHNCYLKADKAAAYAHSLSFDLEVVRPVNGLKVLINLPNRHCRVVKGVTNGVGYLVTRRDGKPHQCVWEIGTLDEAYAASRRKAGGGRHGGGAAAADDDGAVDTRMERELAGEEEVRVLYASFELVYTEDRHSSYDQDESEYDGNDMDDEEDDVFSRTTRSSTSRAANGRAQPSGKSKKREERAKRKQEASQRRAEGTMLSARGVSTKIPTVEVMYSCPGLATGATVRKLQLLEDNPNWQPRSIFDRYVLHYIMYGLESLKLKKLAHYTTWFLQPVLVTQME